MLANVIIIVVFVHFRPASVSVGDILLITKPLGTSVALFAYEIYKGGGDKFEKMNQELKLTEKQCIAMQTTARSLMLKSNRFG